MNESRQHTKFLGMADLAVRRALSFILSTAMMLSLLMNVAPAASVYAATTTVTFTGADLPDVGNSMTKDGVTMTAGLFYPDLNSIGNGEGTFSTTIGKITKIEVYGNYVSFVGEGWSDVDANETKATWTGNPASIVPFKNCLVWGNIAGLTIVCTIEPEEEHTHSFNSYTAGTGDAANTITATCTGDGDCDYKTNGITLTLTAPTDLTYDGTAKAATVSGYPETAPEGLAAAPAISYFKASDLDNPIEGAPTAPGSYTAKISWGGANASVSYNITMADPEASDFIFEAPENLTYDGTDKIATVSTEKSGMGAISVYYFSDAARTESVAETKAAGTYYVGITVTEGTNYSAATTLIYGEGWEFTVVKKTLAATDFDYTGPENLTYDGTDKTATVTIKNTVEGAGEEVTVKYYPDAARTTEVTDTKGIGTYYVGVVVTEGTAYAAATEPIFGENWDFTVLKKTPAAEDFVLTNPLDLTYSGSDKTATVAAKDTAEGMGAITVKYYSDAARETEVTDTKAIGTYYVGIVVAEGDKYIAATTPIFGENWQFTVTKGVPTDSNFEFTAPENLVYDGDAKAATVVKKETVAGMGDVTVKYYKDASRTTEVSAANVVNAGTYYVGITVAAGDNYNASTSVIFNANWKFAITKADPAASYFRFNAPENLIYDGNPKVATVSTDYSGFGDITVHYYSDSARMDEIDPTTVKNASATYFVGITLTNGTNFNSSSNVIYSPDWKFEILQADLELGDFTYKAPDFLVYDGTPKVAAVTTDKKGVGNIIVHYFTDEGRSEEVQPDDVKKIGTYYVGITVTEGQNYNEISELMFDASWKFIVSRRLAVLEWTNTTLVYNGEEQTPTVTISNMVEGDDVEVMMLGGKTDVGMYTATASKIIGEDADNYLLPAEKTHVFNIVKANDNENVTVSIEDWTYGDEASEPEVTGVAEGKEQTIEYKVYGANNSTYSKEVPTEAGMYNIRLTVKGDSNNEKVVSENSFSILPKEVEIEAGEVMFVYDGTDKLPTVTVKGLLEADEGKVEAEIVGAATAVGEHKAVVAKLSGEAASNYTLPETVNIDFTIVKAVIPIDEGDNPAKLTMESWTYGEDPADPVVENNIGGGTVNFGYLELTPEVISAAREATADIEEVDEIKAALVDYFKTLDYVSAKPSQAGVYIIKAEIGATENYEAATLISAFIISPKVASLEWGETSFVYDGEEYVPECEVANLVNGDKCTVTVKGAESEVGDYEAEAIKLSNPNYMLPTTTTTAFTISKDYPVVTVSISGWTYGDEANDPVISGNIGDGEESFVYYKDEARSEKTGEADGAEVEGGVPTCAGTYYVEAYVEATDGYESGVAVAEFTIEKKILALEWTDISLTYNGKEQAPKVGATNLVGDDKVEFTVSGAASAAGEYVAEVSFTDEEMAHDYALPAVAEQKFVISPKEAELKWGKTEFVYNGVDQIPTVEVANLEEGDICDITVTGAATAVGIHKATVLKLSNGNYSIPDEFEKEFEIIKADLLGDTPATLTMESWTYGDDPADPVIENNIGGGTVNFKYFEVTEEVIEQVADLTDEELDALVAEYPAESVRPSNVGVYVVRAEIGATDSYNGTVLWSAFVIIPKVAELSWGETSFVYDGTEYVPECEVTNLVNGDKCDVIVEGAASAAGDYKAKAVDLSNDNYILPEDAEDLEVDFSIAKDMIYPYLDISDWEYGDEPNEPEVFDNTGDGEVTYTYFTDPDCEVKTTEADGAEEEGGVPSFAGTYYLKAEVAETDGYMAGSTVESFKIYERIIDIEWSDGGFVYDGKEHAPEAKITNIVGDDKVELEVSGAEINVGEYEAVADFKEEQRNYDIFWDRTREFKISPKEAEFTWGETEFVYNGADQIPTVEVSNLEEGDTCELTVTGAATAVGTHKATVIKLSNDNYKIPDDFEMEFTIIKAQLLGDNPATLTMGSWIYGDDPADPVIENNIGGGTVNFKYFEVTEEVIEQVADLTDEELDALVAEYPAESVRPSNVGVYVVRAEIGATDSYNGTVLWSAFVIIPKVAELSWGETSFVYDGTEYVPTCEVTNLVNGDKCYVTVNGATSEVGEHEAEAVELSNDNYVLPETVTTTFIISKDFPVITVSISGWTYGDEAKEPSISGNIGGGEESFVYYKDEARNEKTGEADGAEEEGGVPACAGTYYVEASVEATDGYEAGVAVAEFTIEKKILSVEWTETSLTYNGKEQAPKAEAEGVVEGDEILLTVSGAETDAGEYVAEVSFADEEKAHDYALPAVTSQRFKIAKKAAEFTWGETEFVYNGVDQIPTVEVSNLEEGDTCDITVTGAATAVGTHKATVIKLSNANYEIPEEFEMEFTIVKADLEEVEVIISDWTYGENPSVPKVEGNVEGANVTYEYKAADAEDSDYTTTVPSKPGDYTVKAKISATAGYNEAVATADFSILTAEAEVIKAPKAVTGLIYDGKANELVVDKSRVTGGELKFALGEDAETAPSDDAFDDEIPVGTDAGTYYVWYKVFADEEYADTEAVCIEVSIAKRTVIVSGIKAEDKVYDGTKDAAFDYSEVEFFGMVDGDELTVTVTGKFEDANAGEEKNVTFDSFEVGGASVANYVAPAAAQQMEAVAAITPAESAVVTAPEAKELMCNLSEQELVFAGEAENGTMYYAIGEDAETAPADEEFSEDIPTAINAGTYYVWYKVVGDENHSDTEAEVIEVVIKGWPFNDVTVDHVLAEEIVFAYEAGIVSGYGEPDENGQISYRPDDDMTRAQFAIMIYNMAGKPELDPGLEQMAFSDVAEGTTGYTAIMWASANGIISGFEGGIFKPTKSISRSQMIMMLNRYADFTGYEGTTESSISVDSFEDASEISESARPSLQWGIDNGIIAGVSDTRLDPNGTTRRDQCAAFCARFLKGLVS